MGVKEKKVAIIGTGPAGLAAAEALSKRAPHISVVLFDKGRPASARTCPVDMNRGCGGCRGTCNVISGFGGCLQYGDAMKLSRFPAGRRLKALLQDSYDSLEYEAMEFFEALDEEFIGTPTEQLGDIRIRTYPVAEVGEARLATLLLSKYTYLKEKYDVRLRTRVTNIERHGDEFLVESQRQGIAKGDWFDAVLVAAGRSGITDVVKWITANNIESTPGTFSLGIRFELPSYLLSPLYAAHKDFKFTDRRFKSKIKSFCFSAHPETGGMLKYCHYQDQFNSAVIFLDAHTNIDGPVHDQECLGNFALLMQVDTNGSARDWINSSFVPTYSQVYAGRPIWQPLTEILGGTTRNSVQPSVRDIQRGEITKVIPENILVPLLSSYSSLSLTAAEHGGYDVSQYRDLAIAMAPAVEFVWDTVNVSSSFETNINNFFVLGDSAGLAQGILQAAISGFAASRELISRL
ncbi:MAG: FAD-dependent oxidoreductase [Acidobacteriota bacterium]|nr:FAD-dependent oxidoreductase [Acidobacteriota bacterium]